MDGGSLPPVMSLGELRKQPYYTEELEDFYTRDWTPMRAKMTAKASARDNVLRRLKEESPVTLSDMAVDYMKNFPEYFIQDMKDERKLVATAVGVGGGAALGLTGLTRMVASGIINTVTTEALKKLDEERKKKIKAQKKATK